MGTADGISTEDWDVVHQLAVDIVNAPDDQKAALQQKLLKHLETLETKYGPLPSILATRADYIDHNDPAREELFVRAYATAKLQGDVKNMTHVAHSLAALFIEHRRLPEADKWLTFLREALAESPDPHYLDEYDRLRNEYRRLAIRSSKDV